MAEIDRQVRLAGMPLDQGGASRIKLVVGVSGGADSVALLLGCVAIAQRTRMRKSRLIPIAAHVHHHLRVSADADANWVHGLCRRFGVPLRVVHVHPAKLNGNVSANARDLRYQSLARIASKVGARFVAVGHHADDQLETVIMNLCRGGGLDALAGMSRVRPLTKGIHLVRPLLHASKTDCEDFCRTAGMKWRRDPSNLDASKARARLRRDVMPVLNAMWPDAARRTAATTELLEAAAAVLEQQLEASFGSTAKHRWNRATLARLAIPMIAAGLRRAALAAMPDVADQLGQRQLLAAAQAISSTNRRPLRFDWPGGLQVNVTSTQISLQAKRTKSTANRRGRGSADG